MPLTYNQVICIYFLGFVCTIVFAGLYNRLVRRWRMKTSTPPSDGLTGIDPVDVGLLAGAWPFTLSIGGALLLLLVVIPAVVSLISGETRTVRRID